MNQTSQSIVFSLRQLSDKEREQVLSDVLDHFCVGCGVAGDFKSHLCQCEPRCYDLEAIDQAAE